MDHVHQLAPDELRGYLHGRVLKGTVDKGKVTERTVFVDFRNAAGAFVRQGTRVKARETKVNADHLGFIFWWLWWPYWYWYWYPDYVVVYDTVNAPVEGRVRVSVRERDVSGKSEDDDDNLPQYELASVDILRGDDDSATLTVSSLGIVNDDDVDRASSPELPIAVQIAQRQPPAMVAAFWRRKKAPNDLLWKQLAQKPGAEGAISIGVEREDPSVHPWAGTGSAKKYTLDGIQGVNLWLQGGSEFYYEAHNVPSEHPFHFTRSALGGKTVASDQRLSRHISKGNSFPPLAYRPSGASRLSHHFFQCTNHSLMGGKVTVYLPRTSLIFVEMNDDGSERAVMRSFDTNKIIVASTTASTTYDTLGEALSGMDIQISTKPVWKMAASTVTSDGGVFVTPLIDPASEVDGGADDNMPVVIMRDGTMACDHVHAMGPLREWMRSPHRHAEVVCPVCV